MTLDEAIKTEENVAEENQRIVDTGIVFDDVTLDVLYCDDTEVIEEHLASYQKCAEGHRQIAGWLKELKQLKEQTKWIPVSERLPELEERVLIFTTDKEYHVAYRRYKEWQNIECEWFIFGLFGASLAYDEEEVIAWMPLPKPYKESE